jgi:hypothetical protein
MRPFPMPNQDNEINQLRNNVQACGAAVAEARKISSYPDGAYWIDWNFKRPIDTLLPHGNAVRKVSPLLLADALVRAADKDGDGAVQSAIALLNMAHYQRDEPVLITQLVRVVIRLQAIHALERAMTCANVPDDALILLQQILQAEAAAPGLRVALRGERASTDSWAASVAKGEGSWGALSVSDDDVAWYLREVNAMIDLAHKPTLKHASEWQSLVNEIKSARNDIRNIMPAVDKVSDKLVRSDAQMQTAAIAMAVERYRRAKGDWPSDLKQLVPTYMKSLPVDPYTGEPFRYSRLSEGVSVYSLPKGAFDSKGEFRTIGFADHESIGFRLINGSSRR